MQDIGQLYWKNTKESFNQIVHKGYKILETDIYPDVIRLGCLRQCHKFLDVEGDVDTKEVVDIINSQYRKEHVIKEDWKPDKILKYR